MKNQLLFSILALAFIAGCTNSGKAPSESSLMHVCTAEEKAAQVCTMEYMPVCGNDGVTYGNKCAACSSGIDSWVSGECAENDSSLAASGALSEESATYCRSTDKLNHMCLGPVEEVCGNDGLTYENGCRACSFGNDYHVPGPCDGPNSWSVGFASLEMSNNESRHNFDFSQNMIIESFESSGDIYIDSMGFISAICAETNCTQIAKEEELSYAQMQKLPEGDYFKGIEPVVDGKYWIKTIEGSTVKMDIISIEKDGTVAFNWAIKI